VWLIRQPNSKKVSINISLVPFGQAFSLPRHPEMECLLWISLRQAFPAGLQSRPMKFDDGRSDRSQKMNPMQSELLIQ
jgi:hypothetical protein